MGFLTMTANAGAIWVALRLGQTVPGRGSTGTAQHGGWLQESLGQPPWWQVPSALQGGGTASPAFYHATLPRQGALHALHRAAVAG